MKLLSIRTTNFKKLRAFSCDFTDGLNTIIGDNAAGKTTLLQAIITVFYGPSVVPGKTEDIPTWGQKNFKILLEFEHDTHKYLVERDIRNAKITKDGDLVASGNSVCTKFIEDLFTLNFKNFLLFVLSQQGETSSILTFGATALQKRVEAFSGADILDRALGLIRSEMNILSRNMKDADLNEFEEALKMHLQRQKQAHKQLGNEEISLDLYKAKEDDLKQDLQKERSFLKAFIDRQHKLTSVQQEIRHTKIQLESAKDALEQALDNRKTLPELIEIDEVEMEVAELNKEFKRLNGLHRELQEKQRQYEKLLDQQKVMTKQIQDRQRYAEQLQQVMIELNPLSEKESTLQEDWRVYSHKLKDLKAAAKEGVCSACNRPFDDHDPEMIKAEINQLQELVEATEEELNATRKTLKPLKDRVKSLESQVDRDYTEDLARVEEALESFDNAQDFDKELEVLEDNKFHVKHQVQQLNNKIDQAQELEAKHNRANKQVMLTKARVDEAEGQLNVLTDKLELVQADLNELNPDIEDPIEYRKDRELVITDLEARLTQAAEDVKAQTTVISDLKNELALVEKDVKLITKKIKEIIEVAEEHDKHKRLAKFIADSRAAYLQKVWDQILGIASHKVAISTAGKISRIHRDEKGDFVAEEEGKWVPIANCSGAQKAHIGVAMRVGLSSALYGNTGLLILDEPTADMNDTNALNLAGSLMGLGGQCLMITHRSYEQLAAQNVVAVK